MSKQKFTIFERQALWMAHSKKCAYTGEVLGLQNMHIDHIVNEGLAENPAAFAKLKADWGLPDDFDIYGYGNLLPCTQARNLQKNDLQFDKPTGLFFLQIAANKIDVVETNIEKLKKQQDKFKGVLVLQGLIGEGKLSVEEVASLLENYQSKTEDVFELIEGLGFVEHETITRIRKTEIDELRKLPIKLGLNTHIDGVELTNDNTEKVFVRTCEEYENAMKSGFFPYTTFDIKMATYFEHQCGLLKSLATAEIPEVSHIANPRIGIVDLHLLPFNMFFHWGDQKQDWAPNTSYQDKIDQGELFVKSIKSNLLRIESEANGQQLIEVARADFNNDGIEDILLFEYCYAVGGTFGAGGIKVISRTTPNGLFEEIDMNSKS